jgi:hypothetical protein
MNFFRRLVIISGLLVCLFSCGHIVKPFHYINQGTYTTIPIKTINIWIDKDFGGEDQLSIDNAIAQWNYALNGYIHLNVVSTKFDMEPEIIKTVLNGGGWLLLKIQEPNPMIDDGPTDNGNPKYYTLAWANAIGGNRVYFIRNRLKNEWMTGVTLHEIGHLLGAEHDKVYLMQPHFNWEDYRCVDYEALKRVATYQQLPFNRLNYCVYGEIQSGDTEKVMDPVTFSKMAQENVK